MRLSRLFLFFTLFFSFSFPSFAQDVPKVAFLYISPADDDTGWTRQHERGRRAAAALYGDRVQLDYFDNIATNQQALEKMRELADDGYDMFFTTSFTYLDAAINIAHEYPDVIVEQAAGFVRTDNLSTYSARFYQARAVQGLIAGYMTKTNKVGYIAAFPIPEVIRGINAAFLQARAVNPDVQFEVVWVNGWYNPEVEAAAARQLISDGADIIIQHTDTAQPMIVAEELGVYAFGQASDMREVGPHANLTSLIYHWGPYYIQRIKKLLDGTWESTETWNGMSSNMIIIGHLSEDIPRRVKDHAYSLINRLRSGEMNAFTGPINRQDHSPWLAEGEVASDSDLLTMDFFVEGIRGIIPR